MAKRKKELPFMPQLDFLPIRDHKFYRNWSKAPDGAILQALRAANEPLTTVMKCKIPSQVAGGLTDCVVMLEGQYIYCWQLLRSDAAALDVTEYFELGVTNPMPSATITNENPGVLVAHDDGATFLRVHNGDLKGFACVREAGQYKLGHIYFELNPNNFADVGQVAVRPSHPG